MKRYTLSFSKFELLLTQNQYHLDRLYCKCDEVLFIQCRSPKHQTSFLIHVPDIYKMDVTPDISCEILNIELSSEELPSHKSRFLFDIRGNLIDCDLATISSTHLCLYRHTDDNMVTYNIGSKTGEIYDSVEEFDDEPLDEITILEKQAKDLLNDIQGGDEFIPEKVPPPSPVNEIEFVVEQDSTTLEGEEISFTIPESEGENEVLDEDSLSESEEHVRLENSVPPQLGESDIFLGIVYVAINISTFYSQIQKYERTLTRLNGVLEENELEMRKRRFLDIEIKHKEAGTILRERFDLLIKEEEELRRQQIRLSVVLIQVNIMKQKIENNRSEETLDKISQIENIYNTTRETIHELNMDLLHLRDQINEYMTNCELSIQDLIEM